MLTVTKIINGIPDHKGSIVVQHSSRKRATIEHLLGNMFKCACGARRDGRKKMCFDCQKKKNMMELIRHRRAQKRIEKKRRFDRIVSKTDVNAVLHEVNSILAKI